MAASPTQPDSNNFGLDGLQPDTADEGLSLDQLNQAFAEMLGKGDDPYSKPLEESIASPELAVVDEPWIEPEPDNDAACEITPKSILEAMLFVGHPQNEPLSPVQVTKLMRGVRVAEIDSHVTELNEQYQREGRPYRIAGEGQGYRLVLREEFEPLRAAFFGKVRQHRLAPAAVEVLSLVAYHGQLSATELNRLRGSGSGSILSQLVRRQLLSVEKTEDKPRQLIYRTTPRFLEVFGLSSLDDLPRSQDIDRR